MGKEIMRISDLKGAELSAAMRGDTEGWGEVANANMIRYMQKIEGDKRRLNKCRCGCGQKATHIGKCNGLGLIWGCELRVRRWVKS